MRICPNCGRKQGLFSWKYKCHECGRDLCGECIQFNSKDWNQTGSGKDRQMKDHHFCSENCAFAYFEEYVRGARPPVVLTNWGNTGIGFDPKDEKAGSRHILISIFMADPKKATEGKTPIPPLLYLYSRIKTDLSSRNIEFTEDYSDI